MRKTICLFLAAIAMYAFPAKADTGASVIILGPGHTASPACAAGVCDGTADSTTGTFDVSKVTYIRVQFYCTSGPCTNVLTVNSRSKSNTPTGVAPPWIPLISCTNVTTSGICADGSQAYYNIPVTMQLQVVQSGTGAGTAAAILETHLVTP